MGVSNEPLSENTYYKFSKPGCILRIPCPAGSALSSSKAIPFPHQTQYPFQPTNVQALLFWLYLNMHAQSLTAYTKQLPL